MFIVPGVPENFPFKPKVRKEISAVEWHPLDDLPVNSYGIEPLLKRLVSALSHHTDLMCCWDP